MASHARPVGRRLGGVETCSGLWEALRKSGAFRIRLVSEVDVRVGDVSGGVDRASDGIDIEGVLDLCSAFSTPWADMDALRAPLLVDGSGSMGKTAS